MPGRGNRTEIDMLHGPILGRIVQFAIPVALSGLLQQLFNAADIAVVGNYARHGAQAAVSGNSFVINLMVNLFIGISVGTNVQMAACRGRGDREALRRTLHTSLVFALIIGLLLMVAGWFAAPLAHRLLGTGAEPDGGQNAFVLSQAVVYFRIYFLAMPFIMLYNFAAAILRAKGDTRRPLVVLTLSGLLNVLLNMLFVIVFHLNAEGVAIATAVSNAISACALIRLLLREDGDYRLDPKLLRLDGRTLAGIVRVGLPAGIQTSMFSVANVMLQASINALGTDVAAATGIGIYCEYFSMNMIIGFSQAATTFIGQNFAAGNLERCRKVTRIALVAGALSTFAVSGTIMLFRNAFIALFLDTTDPANAEIARIAGIRIAKVGLFQCVNSLSEIFSGSMRGMRRALVPALISIVTICGVRLVWVFCFHTPAQGYEHLIFCYRLSWFVNAASMGLAYSLVLRQARKEIGGGMPSPAQAAD